MAQLLCEVCGDDGRRTLEPAYRGGPQRIAGDCDACPRCAVCEIRLAEAHDQVLRLEGWDAYCGLGHLAVAMQSRTLADRALYALDLLGTPPLAQPEFAELLGLARNWLAEFTPQDQ